MKAERQIWHWCLWCRHCRAAIAVSRRRQRTSNSKPSNIGGIPCNIMNGAMRPLTQTGYAARTPIAPSRLPRINERMVVVSKTQSSRATLPASSSATVLGYLLSDDTQIAAQQCRQYSRSIARSAACPNQIVVISSDDFFHVLRREATGCGPTQQSARGWGFWPRAAGMKKVMVAAAQITRSRNRNRRIRYVKTHRSYPHEFGYLDQAGFDVACYSQNSDLRNDRACAVARVKP